MSMIFLKKPADFSPKAEVVSCFFEHDGKFLLLRRRKEAPQGDTWCVPGGKIEKGETLVQAMLRESGEETGFAPNPSQLAHFKKLYVRYPAFDFVYDVFHYPLLDKFPVALSHEHTEYRWAEPTEALTFNLIPDEDACIKMFYSL
jgi:8-oxo-dGTP pyrophosphatase MutT (NUDIX family)